MAEGLMASLHPNHTRHVVVTAKDDTYTIWKSETCNIMYVMYLYKVALYFFYFSSWATELSLSTTSFS